MFFLCTAKRGGGGGGTSGLGWIPGLQSYFLLALCASLTCVTPTHPFTVIVMVSNWRLLFCNHGNSSYLIKVRLACAASPSLVY